MTKCLGKDNLGCLCYRKPIGGVLFVLKLKNKPARHTEIGQKLYWGNSNGSTPMGGGKNRDEIRWDLQGTGR